MTPLFYVLISCVTRGGLFILSFNDIFIGKQFLEMARHYSASNRLLV